MNLYVNEDARECSNGRWEVKVFDASKTPKSVVLIVYGDREAQALLLAKRLTQHVRELADAGDFIPD